MYYLKPPLSYLENKVHCMRALELMRLLPDASIDAIITDLPYGTTACSWDTIIPFEPMWAGVKRILKPRGAFVTTASQPFTSKLVCSNLDWFKYEWIAIKNKASDFINANYRPMKTHENIIVFSPSSAAPGANEIMNYYPQGINYMTHVQIRKGSLGIARDRNSQQGVYLSKGNNYPQSIIKIAMDNFSLHPTQKPVDLYDYLIRTYTQPGELVLDFCAGSGTTALAARQLNRRFIVGDSSPEYCALMERRLAQSYTPNMFEVQSIGEKVS